MRGGFLPAILVITKGLMLLIYTVFTGDDPCVRGCSCTVLYCACNKQYVFLRLRIWFRGLRLVKHYNGNKVKRIFNIFPNPYCYLVPASPLSLMMPLRESLWYICHLLHAGANHKSFRIYYKLNFHLLLILLKMSMHTNVDMIPLFSLFCTFFSLRKLSLQAANLTAFCSSYNQKYFEYLEII